MTTKVDNHSDGSDESKPPWAERIVESLVRVAGVSVIVLGVIFISFFQKNNGTL